MRVHRGSRTRACCFLFLAAYVLQYYNAEVFNYIGIPIGSFSPARWLEERVAEDAACVLAGVCVAPSVLET